MPNNEGDTPEGLTDGQGRQVVARLITMFYDEGTGRCGKGTEMCGIVGKASLAASNQHMVAKIALNIPGLVSLVAYYAIALPISLLASIVRFRVMIPRFVVSETNGGVGVRFGSPPRRQ